MQMHLLMSGWVASLLWCCTLAGQSGAALVGVKRIYVDQFTIKKSSSKLRGDVVAQLQKLKSVTLVSDSSKADAILSGDGEIWVKGYRSLNPRSGRSPLNGTPLFAGFLSVELKDAKGETLWSYLVTPGHTSEDINRELSKLVEKRLAEALEGHSVPDRP